MALIIPNLSKEQKVDPQLGEALQKQQTYINLTAASKGSWVAASIYSVGDIVIYSGILYRSLINVNTNNVPTSNTGQWQLVGVAQIAPPTFVTPRNRNG
jgi:hypothetical protein